MSATADVFIDGVDVTQYAVAGSSTRRLNRPSEAQVKLPMTHSIGGAGSLLRIYIDGVLHHHGRVLLCEVSPETDTGYTVYNSTDPLEMWKWRPVRDPGGEARFTSSCGKFSPTDDPGDFSKPTIIQDFVTGTEIVEAMMFASQNIADVGADDAEGPLFLANGSFACGGADLTGAPVDWPITMADLASLLISTGTLDLVVTPIELDGNGNYGQLDAYNGDYGTDLSSSVVFQYGMGAFNVQSLRWNEDMTNLCNKLWYYIGPKCDDQHWPASVTTANDMSACCCVPGCGTDCNDIRDAIIALQGTDAGVPGGDSRGTFGVRMDIKIFDGVGDNTPPCTEGDVVGLCLYYNLWLRETFLRVKPQTLVHVTPTRDSEIGTFDIGDLVLVECTSAVKGGFSGAQRVYEYTISWDATDSVPALSELQTSLDNEGFG